MTSDRILRTDIDALCILTLNRPDKLNALDTQAFETLDAHLAALEEETDRIGCVLLKAEGRAFCAGADLAAIGKAHVDPAFKPGVIDRLSRLPQPVVAAVHGACVTGGLELVLAADFIVADGTVRFADTHGKWGLVGAWGMMQRLPRRIGAAAAKRMMMTGYDVRAGEARDIGLIDMLAAVDDLDTIACGLASAILAHSWHTNFAVKRTMRETDGMSLSEALAYERLHYPGNAPDHQDRIARFGKT